MTLPGGARAGMASFLDPHPFATGMEQKVLRVSYWFNGRRHEVEVTDAEALQLPLRSTSSSSRGATPRPDSIS